MKNKESLFQNSTEKSDYSKAASEWVYTGYFRDAGAPTKKCELCGHIIRYQFEIYNKTNFKRMMVGSDCIKSFGIRARDMNGKILTQKETIHKLDDAYRQATSKDKQVRVETSLRDLADKDKEFKIEGFISYYQKNETFSPGQLSILSWRFEKANIPFEKQLFKVSLKTGKDKDQLLAMETWKVEKIWDCLNQAQKEWYRNNIHKVG